MSFDLSVEEIDECVRFFVRIRGISEFDFKYYFGEEEGEDLYLRLNVDFNRDILQFWTSLKFVHKCMFINNWGENVGPTFGPNVWRRYDRTSIRIDLDLGQALECTRFFLSLKQRIERMTVKDFQQFLGELEGRSAHSYFHTGFSKDIISFWIRLRPVQKQAFLNYPWSIWRMDYLNKL